MKLARNNTMLYVISIIILIAFSILACKNFKLALAVLAGLLPLYLIRLQIGSLPTTLLEIMIVIVILVWLSRFKDWKSKIMQFRSWFLPLGLLLFTATIGIFIAPNVFDALGIWKAYFLEPILLFFILVTTLKDKKDWIKVLKALAISSIILSAIGIMQYETGFGIPAPWDIENRITSIFDYPNALGLFLAPIVAMSFILSQTLKQGERSLWIATTLLGSIAIILAETEAALIAIPAGLLLTLVVSNVSWRTKIRTITATAAILIIAFTASGTVRSKLMLQDYSGQVRISQWTETVQLLGDKPVFGSGLNGYPTALEPYHDPTFYEIFQYPHNIVLNIWTELGLLGLLAFAMIAWRTFKTQQTKKDDLLVLATFAGLAVMVIHGLVDVPFFKNDLAVMTFILLAMIAQKHNRASKTDAVDVEPR